jgi:hypothetical protein
VHLPYGLRLRLNTACLSNTMTCGVRALSEFMARAVRFTLFWPRDKLLHRPVSPLDVHSQHGHLKLPH